MNLLFFLTPKQDVLYIYEDFTLRQTLEKWSNQRYATIPVLKRNGEYVKLKRGWDGKNITRIRLIMIKQGAKGCTKVIIQK